MRRLEYKKTMFDERFLKRFYSKIDKRRKCWQWLACTDGDGYGLIVVRGIMYKAHRIIWFLFHGRVPRKCILHTCDNPSCVNPSHLYEGTHKDNALDRKSRNRGNHAVGEATGVAKLTTRDVEFIKDLSRDFSRKELADVFEVDRRTIDRIITGKNWKHI